MSSVFERKVKIMAQISKRGNSYTIRCYCGEDTNGKRVVKNMTWKPDENMTPKQIEKELERIAVSFEEQCAKGLVLDNNITFEKYVNTVWLPRVESEIKPTTFTRYKGMLKRTLPALGHYKMCQIQPYHLYSFYDNLRETKREDSKFIPNDEAIRLSHEDTRSETARKIGISTTTVDSVRAGKSVSSETAEKFAEYFGLPVAKLFNADEVMLSDRTILHHHRLISTIMQSAVYDEVIRDNPCKRTHSPKVERKEANFLDDVQAEKLLDTVMEKADHPFDVLIALILHTGMRRGEACGLNWEDIDFRNCTVNICRSLLYLPEKGVFENDTKTYSSTRIIKVGQDVIDMLADFKKWQDSEAEKLETQWIDSGKVFTAANGSVINPGTVSSWFHKFVRDNNLPQVSIHGLRHTCASIMISSGVPITTTAKRLGHSTSATTSKIYAHAIASADAATAQVIQSILPIKRKNQSEKPLLSS
jgi:integrase